MDLPSNVGFGTVTAEFMRQVADTIDPGREPDAVPMAGLNISFTSSVTGGVIRNPTAGKIIVLEPVNCTTDANGVMVGPDGDPGIVLIGTDDEDLDPHGWTWKATITGTGLPTPLSFSFDLPVGANLNLATVIPVPGSPGVSLADGLIRSVTRETLVEGDNITLSPSEDGKTIVVSAVGGYQLPAGGLPRADLQSTVQASLDKADTAVQAGASTVFTGVNSFTQAPDVPDGAFPIAKTSGLQSALTDRELTANKGVANGYASLDSGGKIPAGQLGSTLMAYQGTWNASTNTPTLVDGTGTAGHVYRVATAGTRNLGGGSQTFNVGDDVIYSGTAWQGSANPSAVVSVAGKTGAVTLSKADVTGIGNVDNTADADKPVSTAQANAIGLKANDNAVVKLTGNQTKAGVLTLTDGVVVPDASIPQAKVTGLPALITSLPETIRDVIGAALVNSPTVTVNVDDDGDTISFTATGGSGGTAATIPTNGTTNAGPAIQAAYDAGATIFNFIPGATYVVNTPVFFDSSDVYSKVVLNGNGAKISMGSSLPTVTQFTRAAVRWAFFNNIKRAALSGGVVNATDTNRGTGVSVGGLTRLYINNLTFVGSGDYLYGAAYGQRTAARFEGCTLLNGYTLLSWEDYADTNALIHCQLRSGHVDAALVHQTSEGDGLLITSPKVDSPRLVANLSRCNGAVIDGDVTAAIALSRCSGIVINGWHMEGRDDGAPGLLCKNSQVTINAPILYNRTTSPYPGVIRIDDNPLGADRPSDITIVGGLAMTSVFADGQNGPFLEIISAIANTTVRAIGFRDQLITTASSNWFTGNGPRIKGSATMVATIAANEHLLAGGTWELARTKGSAWVLGPLATTGLSVQRALANPAITSLSNAGSPLTGTLTASTPYYYCYALMNSAGQYTTATSEVTVTTNAQRATMALLTLPDFPVKVVVWRRGATTGVKSAPTAYAVLSAGAPEVRLVDTGATVNGVPWITTSIPVPNTVAATNGTTAALYIDGVAV